ncbi:MAG: hypothetical protein M5U19_22820 [Microthrixaceae bacterium]|nr:hypothetical protein [Microthrixaceae bacterium]
MDWYLDPTRWEVPLATSGPADWPRIERGDGSPLTDIPHEPVDPVEVTDVSQTDDSISFEVSEPGTPVLVKTSYFPNWNASGADGPYRVSPNFMVVVPTQTEVTLTYGRSAVEWLGWLMTLAGLAIATWLARRDSEAVPAVGSGVVVSEPGTGVVVSESGTGVVVSESGTGVVVSESGTGVVVSESGIGVVVSESDTGGTVAETEHGDG